MDDGYLDASKVRLRREALGLTQKQAAERIPVNPKTVVAWESAEHAPARVYLHVLQAFARAYDCEVTDFLTIPDWVVQDAAETSLPLETTQPLPAEASA